MNRLRLRWNRAATRRELMANHAMGVELQLLEAVSQLERARTERLDARARELERVVDDLHVELARTAEELCGGDTRPLSSAVGSEPCR